MVDGAGDSSFFRSFEMVQSTKAFTAGVLALLALASPAGASSLYITGFRIPLCCVLNVVLQPESHKLRFPCFMHATTTP